MDVGSRRPLGDQTFPAAAAGIFPVRDAVADPMWREAERTAVLERATQERFAPAEREAGQIAPVQMQYVENVQKDLYAGTACCVRIIDLHAALQPGEARPSALEGDDLSVDHEVLVRLAGQCLDEFGVVVVECLAVAGEQSDTLRGTEDQTAFPVEFALVQPVRVREAVLGQGGEHRRDPLGLGHHTRTPFPCHTSHVPVAPRGKQARPRCSSLSTFLGD